MTDNYSDRRQYPRVWVEFVTVEVYFPDGQVGPSEFCYVINISEGGMLFRSQHPYVTGQKIRVTFLLPPNDTAIRSDALIVHTHESHQSQFIGVQFVALRDEDRLTIQEFVKSKLD